ncbi:MAG: amidohydrolase family protein [Bacteroidota bacterium]
MTKKGMPKGCLRPLLVTIIFLTSASFAIQYFFVLRGTYDGKEASYKSLALVNGRVWNGVEPVIDGGKVIIEGSDITCVGRDCETPQGAKVVDVNGMAIMPALFDMSAYFFLNTQENEGKNPLSQLLTYLRLRPEVRKNFHRNGITNFRSTGDPMQNILEYNLKMLKGEIMGPRVYAAGPIFTAVGGHPVSTWFAGDEGNADAFTYEETQVNVAKTHAVEVYETGMEGIKIVYDDMGGTVPKLDSQIVKGLIEQAGELNMWVAVQTGTNQDIREVVRWGAEMIEYGARDVIDSTTLKLLVDEKVTVIPSVFVSEVTPKDLSPDWFARPAMRENIQRLEAAGVWIATGASTGPGMSFGASLLAEMDQLMRMGMDAENVLNAATRIPAQTLQLDDRYGTLEPGKTADVIIVDGSPWVDVKALENIHTVIQDGKLVVVAREIQD